MPKNKTKRPRTYARNRAVSRSGRLNITEADSKYILKLVIVTVLGTLWVKFQTPALLFGWPLTAVPFGLLLGFILIKSLEKNPLNRRILYAVLLVVGIISYFVPAGIII